jgi:Pvc16 N-terminal domain
MIFQAVSCIENELKDFYPELDILAANISDIVAGENSANNDADIIISLINIEENRISRDPRNYLKSGTGILLKNPAVHLNLTLLFTAIKSRTVNAYGSALQSLQQIIQFFQAKYVFDHTNTGDLDSGIEKLVLEMVSINPEQLNHLWSILGGKYYPSVVYKMRMVTIDSVPGTPGDIITEIDTKYFA